MTVVAVEEEWEDAGEDEGREALVGVAGVDEAIAFCFLWDQLSGTIW